MFLLLWLLTLTSLPQSSGATGVVLNHEGKPLPGAHVYVSDSRSTHDWPLECAAAHASNDRPVRHGFTDLDGRFSFARLNGGPARLVVRAAGHATLRMDSIRLAGRGSTNLGSIQLAQGAKLKGIVKNAQDEPIKGARIYSFPHRDRSKGLGKDLAAFEVETNTRGEFELESLPLGDWTLLIEGDDYPVHRFEGTRLQREFLTNPLPFRLTKGVLLRGRVNTMTSERNLNKLEIRAIPADELIPNGPNPTYSQGYVTATAERTGTFKLEPLRPDTLYLLRAQEPEDSFLKEDRWAPMSIVNSNDESARIEWLPSCKVKFRALDVATAEAPDEFQIRILGATPEEPYIDATPKKNHVIEGVRPTAPTNEFLLRATGNGYREFQSRTFELVPGQTIRAGDVSFWKHATVTVRVMNRETGSPIPGAQVILKETEAVPPPRRTAKAVTDGAGRATLNQFPGSPLAIGVIAQGFAPTILPSPFELKDGEFQIELTEDLEVAARILDSDGEPVVGYGVRRTYGEDHERFLFAGTEHAVETLYTDNEGIARFTGLGAFEYAFELVEWDNLPGTFIPQRILPIVDAEQMLSFGLDPTTHLIVKIVESHLPLAAAELRIGGQRIRTNQEGKLRVDGLRPGLHRYQVTHPNRVMSHVDEVYLEVTENELEIHLPVGSVTGEVVDGLGKGLAGVPIYIFEDRWLETFDAEHLVGKNLFRSVNARRPEPSAVTDHDGRFTLHGVRESLGMTVSARTADGFTGTVRVRGIRADSNVETGPIVVRPPATLKIVALNEEIRPKGILTLVATFQGETQAGGWPYVEAPYTGRSWWLHQLPAGWWEFSLIALDDYGAVIDGERFGRVHLEPGEEREYSLDH